MIVRTNNMAVVSHINRQGGSRLCTLNRLARRLLLWSQDKFLSLRAVHIPAVLNLAADFLSRQKLRPGEWMLNCQGSVRRSGSEPLCTAGVVSIPALVLPEFPSTSGHRCIHPSLAEYETVRVSASQADSGSPVQGEGERCSSPTHSPVLAIPDMVLRADSSSVSATLGDYDQAGPALSASGQDLASEIRDLEAVGMAHPGPRALISSLPAEVQETIASARAPATRKLYSSKWRVFESWCLAHAVDPANCPIGPVLEFLQEKLVTGAAATTLRFYVAAIAARRELDEIPPGRHRMVFAWRLTAETSTPYWSTFLGLISRS